MMKIIPVQGFGSKLMVASKAVNTIPENYLSYSRNARIYDGGIWPRRGKSRLFDGSSASWSNRGAFVMNSKLFQIADQKIFSIASDGTRTQLATLGHDAVCDVMVNTSPKGAFNAIGASPYTEGYDTGDVAKKVARIAYFVGPLGVCRLEFMNADWTTVYEYHHTAVTNEGYDYPAVRIWFAGTDDAQDSGTGRYDSGYYYLESGQYVNLSSPWNSVGNVKYDIGYYSSKSVAIIAGKGQPMKVFDGVSSVTTVTSPVTTSGIVEFTRNYGFTSAGNVLYVSRPATATNPEYAYDFSGAGSQQIVFEQEIVSLKATMAGLYVFTKNRVEFLGANSLQNVAGSATFISTPIGDGMEPITNLLTVASGDKLFTVTKNLQVQTVNFTAGVESAQIGELSARPVVGIREFMQNIDTDQPTGFAHYDENGKTVQFHLRSVGSPFNDYVLVYDLVNDTWNVDTNKNYCYVVKNGFDYYGFSDVNPSVYVDDVGQSDAWVAIEFRIKTQNLNQGTPFQKKYGGFYVMGGIGAFTELNVLVNVDGDNVFQDVITGNANGIPDLGEVGTEIGSSEIAGWLTYVPKLYPFDRMADEWRIWTSGKRVQYEIYSYSDVQDFILDSLGTKCEVTGFMDVSEKF